MNGWVERACASSALVARKNRLRLRSLNRREDRTLGIMIHLQSISLKPGAKERSGFPFDLPLIKQLDRLELHSPVTFFVGENGSGKSTLLEAIGAGVKLATVGGDDVDRDATLENTRALGKRLTFSWLKKTH